MGKYQEVEVKYPLLNVDEVVETIEGLSLLPKITDQVQTDTYFTPSHRNFLDNEIVSEWLRVRESGDFCSINFKQWLPIGAKIQDQCNEFETAIQDSYAMKMILSLLDFEQIVVVDKRRSSWVCDGVEISIDRVKGLGSFIELEALDEVPEEDIPLVHERFNFVLKQINAKIGSRDHRGYPYMLLENKPKDSDEL